MSPPDLLALAALAEGRVPPPTKPRGAAADPGRTLASETWRAYAADWSHFRRWCHEAGCTALPAQPMAVAAYLAALAPSYSRSTLERRLAAIGHAHRSKGLPWSAKHPAIRATLRNVLCADGGRQKQAAPLTSAALRQLVAACGPDLTGLRDRALLLLGFAGALRRSELVAVEREHISLSEAGLLLRLPPSASERQETEVAIARGKWLETCPVRALEAWLSASGCSAGPVFRRVDRWGNVDQRRLCGDAVRAILLRRAKAARIVAPLGERLSPQGLRAGFVTEAYLAGACDEQVMDHTRHRNLRSLRDYGRRARQVSDSATKLLDL